MVVIDLHAVLFTEPRIVTSELRLWGDVRENGENQLVWDSENCEQEMEYISIQQEETTEEFVLKLVWGAGDRPMAGRRRSLFLRLRPFADLVKNESDRKSVV